MDGLNNLVQMIGYYTEQIERYESLSTWCALFSIVCIMAVIMFAFSLILKNSSKSECEKERYYSVLAGLFLMIPSITTLYLYIFAMNMRKVALFRGYLGFLENQWNTLANSDMMLFDLQIIEKYFSAKAFWVNGLGPAVMTLFLAISAITGFGLAAYFAHKLQKSVIKRALKLLICILGIVCVLFNGLCCYYLCINDSVVKAVITCCEAEI